MKYLKITVLALLMAACSPVRPLSVRVVESEMARCPEPAQLDFMEGRLKWNYTTGLELRAFLDVSERYGLDGVFHYVEKWYDDIISEDGSIKTYKLENYSTDHICPGATLFRLYDRTGKEKYRRAMDTLRRQLSLQPRTPEGGFWHKKVYPGQMWLDGLYMAQPFYAEYTSRFVTDSTAREANFEDIVHQFVTVYDHTLDPATGLLRHAWDSSHEMFWCDPETGQSAHAWGRALGWYCMALVDVIEILPDGEGKDTLINLLVAQLNTLPLYADVRTGMWYQVLDSPYREGNYLEATCSAMFTYVFLKSARLGIFGDSETAAHLYDSLLDTFVTEEDGLVTLNDCCEVAGLGGKDNRSGDYEYYINERVRANDPKGIGPLIWASLEYERL